MGNTAVGELRLEFRDGAGNVVVVAGARRYVGTLRCVPPFLVEGVCHEIVVLVGDEPVSVRVRVLDGCPSIRGERAIVQFVGLDAGGDRLRPERREPRPGLSGSLADVPLVEIVQLVNVSRRTAVIEVRLSNPADRPLVQGVIACRDGRATYARLDDGRAAEDAFFALVGGGRGRFDVHYGREVTRVNLTGDTTFLLLEAMRRLDEERRSGTGRFPAMAPPALAAPIADDAVLAQPLFTPTKTRAAAHAAVRADDELPRAQATGRFARFFDELSAQSLAVPPSTPLPPPPLGDAAGRFSSLALALDPVDDPLDRDTEVVTRITSLPT